MTISSRLRAALTTASVATLVTAAVVGGSASAQAATTVTETFALTGCSASGLCSPSYLAGASIQLRSSTGAVLASGTVPASGVWKVSLKSGTSYRLWVNKQLGTSCLYGMGHYYLYGSFVGAATTRSLAVGFSWVCAPPAV